MLIQWEARNVNEASHYTVFFFYLFHFTVDCPSKFMNGSSHFLCASFYDNTLYDRSGADFQAYYLRLNHFINISKSFLRFDVE